MQRGLRVPYIRLTISPGPHVILMQSCTSAADCASLGHSNVISILKNHVYVLQRNAGDACVKNWNFRCGYMFLYLYNNEKMSFVREFQFRSWKTPQNGRSRKTVITNPSQRFQWILINVRTSQNAIMSKALHDFVPARKIKTWTIGLWVIGIGSVLENFQWWKKMLVNASQIHTWNANFNYRVQL